MMNERQGRTKNEYTAHTRVNKQELLPYSTRDTDKQLQAVVKTG